jgi:outer membrane protein assembly factor BamC
MWKLAWILLLVGGCSWITGDRGFIVDRSKEYLDIVEAPPLQIPGGLQAVRIQDSTPVPTIPTPLRPEFFPGHPPRPNAIHGADSRDDVRIQRLGERRWLAIPEDPTTVWPKVRQFLAENGVTLARENPPAGRLDTEWLTVENEPYRDVIRLVTRDAKADAQLTGGRDRIRILVEPGLRERTSEVHLRHENDGFSTPGADELIDLQNTASHLVPVEQDLLNELGAYIAARVAEQTVSMVAQDMGGGVKSFLDRDAEGDPILRLLVDFPRAWATIGQSLARANIDIDDTDESNGRYFINVSPDLEVGDPPRRGFLRRMFSFRSAESVALQIRIEPASDGSQVVTAFAADGAELEREFGQQVLVLLREYSS